MLTSRKRYGKNGFSENSYLERLPLEKRKQATYLRIVSIWWGYSIPQRTIATTQTTISAAPPTKIWLHIYNFLRWSLSDHQLHVLHAITSWNSPKSLQWTPTGRHGPRFHKKENVYCHLFIYITRGFWPPDEKFHNHKYLMTINGRLEYHFSLSQLQNALL